TRCWLMYGQYRESSGRYGGCEPITAQTGSVIEAIDAMHFPMHVRAHRAGLLFHLQYLDPELSRLRGDDGTLLDAVSDMAMMRMMMQLAGLANIRYNDRVLYEYTTGNPESYTTGFESRRLQDRQSDILGRKPPLEPVDWYCPGAAEPSRVGSGHDRAGLLLIALDGTTPRLLHQWSDEGLLPHMQSVLGQGHVRHIEPPRGFGNEVFWCALATGRLPGELGYYYRESWRPDRYTWDFVDLERELSRPPFWAAMDDTDVETAVIDMPEAAHGGRINGLEVTEWLPHARMSPARFSPTELEADWISRFGADRSWGHTETMAPRTGEQAFRLQEQLLEKVQQKTDAALHYLNRGGWDLFAVGYSQAHDVGHQFWHIHDPSHPRHRAIWRKRYGDPLLRIYQAIDGAVGRLMERAGDGARVALVSGLAMEAKVSGNPVLDQILWTMERAWYGDRVGADSQAALARRRFFAVPHNNLSGAVRINLRGREAAGLVEPDSDYRETLDRIEQGLRRVVNADTGEPVVSDIVRVQEGCAGPRAQVLPDLLVIWSRESPLRRVSTPWDGELALRARSITDTRSGDHVNEAALITNFNPGFPAAGRVPAQDVAAWLTAQAEQTAAG
ncbi:MAG TPA: alkaline phosphatase family protein, partial [Arenicellales bacterium]|nr:alkaline phosphatase family protein [Arenicellales bacterium]